MGDAMGICIAVLKETLPHENRVALDPALCRKLVGQGMQINLQAGAGSRAFFNDSDYTGATLCGSAEQAVAGANIVFAVNTPAESTLRACVPGTIVLCFMDPYRQQDTIRLCQELRLTAMPVELVPRISRAQSMDALSSQANLAGYKCALRAAELAYGYFPMLTTAAGTIRPAKVVVIGA
ncbi:MAG: NAD(P)(+) transhydrogenase (Re/Si-specific) subunit alpha, partial [Pseudohongiellaceae bacterium]